MLLVLLRGFHTHSNGPAALKAPNKFRVQAWLCVRGTGSLPVVLCTSHPSGAATEPLLMFARCSTAALTGLLIALGFSWRGGISFTHFIAAHTKVEIWCFKCKKHSGVGSIYLRHTVSSASGSAHHELRMMKYYSEFLQALFP